MNIFKKPTIKKVLSALIACGFVFTLTSAALAYSSPGSPTGFVNDFAGILNDSEKQTLEQKLSNLQQTTTNEVSIVIIDNLDGDYIENYAEKLFQEWGIGDEQRDNGLLVLIALQEREMRIEVGYGLEGDITDAEASRLINNVMKPEFQKGDYFTGINNTVDLISQKLSGQEVEIPGKKRNIDFGDIFYIIFIGIAFLGSILGRSKSWWAGGVVGAAGAGVITLLQGFLWLGLVSFIVLIPLGLLFDFIVSREYKHGKQSGHFPWWIGGGHHGGGSSGGFGGFGGGSSGGGGASGGW